MVEKRSWQGAVEMVRRAGSARGREQLGQFSLEGTRLHERALEAGVVLDLTLLAESLTDPPSERERQLTGLLRKTSSSMLIVPDAVMLELTNGRGLGSVISLAAIPKQGNLSHYLSSIERPLALAAVDVKDPGNVGAMIRSGHAHRVDAFVTLGASDAYHPKAVRTSMGSIFKTPVWHRESLTDFIDELVSAGLETVGAISHDGHPLPLSSFAANGTAVFMGNEYEGLHKDIRQQLDRVVTIPMGSGIDSLSVNAATAVVLYEIRRQQMIVERGHALP